MPGDEFALTEVIDKPVDPKVLSERMMPALPLRFGAGTDRAGRIAVLRPLSSLRHRRTSNHRYEGVFLY